MNLSFLVIKIALLMILVCPYASGASCVERWHSKDGGLVKERRCSKHVKSEGLPSGSVSWEKFTKNKLQNFQYFRKGQDVYVITHSSYDKCQFSTGDTSGMGQFLVSPWCWFGDHSESIFNFHLVSSQGDSFYTLYQRHPSPGKHSYELNLYSVDNDNVYYYSSVIKGADPESFRLLLPVEDLDGANIDSIAVDNNAIYVNNKRAIDAKWNELKHIPIEITREYNKEGSDYYIKTMRNNNGFYVFSRHGYAVLDNVNIKIMQCYEPQWHQMFCVINKRKFQVKPDFYSHSIELEPVNNENQTLVRDEKS